MKMSVLNLGSAKEISHLFDFSTFLNQPGLKLQSIYRHKLSDEFDNEWNPPSNSEVIGPWIIENCCFEPC